MNITLRFFASVRETLGASQETLAVPAQVSTVGELRAFLIGRGGAWAEALAEGRSLRTACDQIMCKADAALTDGCEVAFFPPVTGG
ncbi:molybdopterin converting factor subunit 1 [Janthinobacterium sp.]|uniref:molybdopterin converting factor subunit 1 n=1 Tax=Janthinobacterium sp. TaxID=1871054 RepID=UPI00293D6C7C|nr:molybdopterin converting factor subunit 1 [Janthinobacterium sp.]